MVSWYVDHPFRDGLWHAGLHRGKQTKSFSAAPSPRSSRPLAHNYATAAGNWPQQLLDHEAVWAKAVHRIVTGKISPEQAVDEAIARIKEILSD